MAEDGLAARKELGENVPIPEATALAGEDLDAFVAKAESSWPALALSRDGFLEHIASLVGVSGLSDLAAADLYVAYGCVANSPAAIATFDTILREGVQAAVTRLRLDGARSDDVLQRARERLLVGEGRARPKISTYGGRGPLGAWARVAALRVAYDFVAERSQRDLVREAENDLLHVAAETDPELELLATRYGAALNDALREALLALESRDRALLRYSFVESLSVDSIGTIYGVHRATAARWVAAARERLSDGAREKFRAKVQLTEAELESVTRALRSYLDISLERLLSSET
jgi:RNA polymerase sigma-70 factor (ECF subfamily)